MCVAYFRFLLSWNETKSLAEFQTEQFFIILFSLFIRLVHKQMYCKPALDYIRKLKTKNHKEITQQIQFHLIN